MSTCKWCGEEPDWLAYHAADCELTELRKLRDRIASWGNDAGWRSQWPELTAEMEAIRERAKDLAK